MKNDDIIASYLFTDDGKKLLEESMKIDITNIKLPKFNQHKSNILREKILAAGYSLEELRKDPNKLREALYKVGWLLPKKSTL